MGLRLTIGALRSSSVLSLYADTSEPSLTFGLSKTQSAALLPRIGEKKRAQVVAESSDIYSNLYLFRRTTRLHTPFGYRMKILLQDLPVPNLSIMPSLSYIVAPYSLSLSPLCSSICDVCKSDVPGDIL